MSVCLAAPHLCALGIPTIFANLTRGYVAKRRDSADQIDLAPPGALEPVSVCSYTRYGWRRT
ncbi:hypothetical protein LY76DRAFT_595633 [Colletotrichum caudatum]|nr:hypothetical protein LY76DRAFT_595633 [Colletotrichum caudatum]